MKIRVCSWILSSREAAKPPSVKKKLCALASSREIFCVIGEIGRFFFQNMLDGQVFFLRELTSEIGQIWTHLSAPIFFS